MLSTTRRALIVGTGMLAAGAVLPGAAPARALRYPPGVQLWTVKNELAKDFEGTLRALRRMGYRRVESAGWHGRTAAQFRAAVRAAGLQCVSAHYSLRDLIDDTEVGRVLSAPGGGAGVLGSSPAPGGAGVERESLRGGVGGGGVGRDVRVNRLGEV